MKKIQIFLFATMVMAVLGAGTLSARQLRSEPKGFACSGTCSMTQPCPTSGCVCSFTTPMTGFCTTKLAGAVPGKK